MRKSQFINRRSVALAAGATVLAAQTLLAQVSGTWLGGSGSWSDPTRWTSNPSVPGDGGAAHFGPALNTATVLVNVPVSLGTLSLDAAHKHRLIGNGITLVGPAVLNVAGGSEQTASLFSAGLSGTAGLTKTGDGQVSLSPNNVITGGTNILGGTLIAESSASAAAPPPGTMATSTTTGR